MTLPGDPSSVSPRPRDPDPPSDPDAALAVSFDLDGTLVSFDRPYDELRADAFADCGLPATEATARTYDETFFELFDALEPEPVRGAVEAVLDEHGLDAEPDAVVDAIYEHEIGATTVRPGVERLLDAVSDGDTVPNGEATGASAASGEATASDVRLAVLTNGLPDLQRRKLAAVGLGARFDAVVTSYEVGAHKPAPTAFAAVRDRLPAGAYVHVGDDREADAEGARDAGFVGVHLDPDADGTTVSTPGADALASLFDAR